MSSPALPTYSDEQVRWFRFRRSGLVRGASGYGTPEAVASALIGVQAQILSAATLAFWNRSGTGVATSAELLARLHDTRTLVKLWAQRHTLHIYATEDWPVIQAAFSNRVSWWEREAKRTGEVRVLAEYRDATARVAALLAERGTMGRRDLRALEQALPGPLLSPWGGVFSALVREGIACHARWEGGEARYAHRSHWLPDFPWSPATLEAAGVVVARRYFRAYGPATLQDFAYWAGLSSKDVQRCLQAIAPELVQVRGEGTGPMYLLKDDLAELGQTAPAREDWSVRLLGRFDPLLLAHRDKSWVVPKAFYSRVWRPAGHIEGTVLVHGQAVAIWRYERVGTTKLAVRVYPFNRLAGWVFKAIRREARGVARFFGLQPGEVLVLDTGATPDAGRPSFPPGS